MKNKIYLFGLALCLLAVVSAAPPTFHQFYGQVLDTSGVPVVNNYYVRAYLNGSFVEEVLSSGSYYGWGELFLVEEGQDGEIITFTVNDYFAVNYTYSEDDFTELNLTYDTNNDIICIDSDEDGYNSTGGVCGAVADCNDSDNAINPGAVEICNGIDDDCDPLTTEVCPVAPGGGGGGGSSGGGGGMPFFDLDKEFINVTLKQGDVKNVTFTVTNPTTTSYTVYISNQLGWIALETNNFVLDSGKSKTITVTLLPYVDIEPNLYIDIIEVWTSAERSKITLSAEVHSVDSIFDIVLSIPNADNYLSPGDNLHADFSLKRVVPVSFGGDVEIKYFIRDIDSNDLITDDEKMVVLDEESFSKSFSIPLNAKYGKYVLYTELTYDDGKKAIASWWFDVGPKALSGLRLLIILLILLIALIAIIITIIVHRRRILLNPQLRIKE